jgi:eukaryotic-like serine/threonine-protein kinase
VEIGTTVGRYRIEQRLAAGAMGEVYRAFDPVIGRPVAIKTIRRELIGDTDSDQWLERFKREARAAGRRFHPNIVTILDYGEDDGVPFLAMEFVDGPSLAKLIKDSGPLPPARAALIIVQVLNGLEFAHESGIIHRDIKPSNILVPANGPVKIADFGIARIDASDLTAIGDVLGTPAYVAPEQLRGDPIDGRADLFAAGVMLFEALTGVKPFRGKTLRESTWLMQNRGPEDICMLNPLVSEELRRVIERALAFDPVRRFATAGEFARAIAATVAAAPIAAGSPPPLPLAASAAPSGQVWDAALLQWLERELAIFIGPVAPFAVKQASRATSDVGALCEALAQYIDDQQDRRRFLQIGGRLTVEMPAVAGASPIRKTTAGAPPGTTAAARPTLEMLAEIEQNLTRIIGPIAKIVIKRHLQSSQTLPQLFQALAADIPNERDRAAFLDSLKSR